MALRAPLADQARAGRQAGGGRLPRRGCKLVRGVAQPPAACRRQPAVGALLQTVGQAIEQQRATGLRWGRALPQLTPQLLQADAIERRERSQIGHRHRCWPSLGCAAAQCARIRPLHPRSGCTRAALRCGGRAREPIALAGCGQGVSAQGVRTRRYAPATATTLDVG
jgi:hypothetical protein